MKYWMDVHLVHQILALPQPCYLNLEPSFLLALDSGLICLEQDFDIAVDIVHVCWLHVLLVVDRRQREGLVFQSWVTLKRSRHGNGISGFVSRGQGKF